MEKRPNILITDFDGILSSGMHLSNTGAMYKTINCGNKEAMQIALENNILVFCISSQSNPIGREITKDVCNSLELPIIFSKSSNKTKEVHEIIEQFNPNFVGFVGDDIYDLHIQPQINVRFATQKSKEALDWYATYLKEENNCCWLQSDKPFLEAVLIFANLCKQYAQIHTYNRNIVIF